MGEVIQRPTPYPPSKEGGHGYQPCSKAICQYTVVLARGVVVQELQSTQNGIINYMIIGSFNKSIILVY
jgi:hypothetical protein